MKQTNRQDIVGDGDPLDICVLTERDIAHGDIIVNVRPIGGFRMLDGNSKNYNLFPVLVLVDGVAFNDHSEVLGYNARQLHYIHQYRGDYFMGDSYYGGILSLITHRGMLTDIRMHEG